LRFGSARCCAGSFAELLAADVQNGEAPTLFRERLEISLDRNLDGLFTGKNPDANRRIAKVNLVASPVSSSNDGVWHYGLASQSPPMSFAQNQPRAVAGVAAARDVGQRFSAASTPLPCKDLGTRRLETKACRRQLLTRSSAKPRGEASKRDKLILSILEARRSTIDDAPSRTAA
jgi:hypothetical protein